MRGRLNPIEGDTPQERAENFLEPESVKVKKVFKAPDGRFFWSSSYHPASNGMEFVGAFDMYADFRAVVPVMQ